MAFMPSRVVNTNLDEELRLLGANVDTNDLRVLSTRRLDEAAFTGSAVKALTESKEEAVSATDAGDVDPLDGNVVTHELVKALRGLDFDSLSESQINDLLSALGEKELSESDEDLNGDIEQIVRDLVEARFAVIGGKKTKLKRMSAAERSKSRREYAKRRGSILRSRRKRMKKASVQRQMAKTAAKAIKLGTRQESSDLADRLRGLMNGVEENHQYAETLARIDRVFELISEWLEDDSVTETLEECMDGLRGNLYESDEDFVTAVRPALEIIKVCLGEIELGN